MKIYRTFTLAVLVLTTMSVFAEGQDIDAKTKETLMSVVQSHIAWESKITTHGATIVAKESEHHGNQVSYRLYVTGLPTDRLYTILTWPVTQKELSTAIEGASIGKEGVVMCAGRKKKECGNPATPDDPIDFALNPAPGEPSRLAIASGNFRAAVVIVPRSITNSDKACTIEALRLSPNFEIAYITGKGFPPNTDITFLSNSYDEERSNKTRSDADGNLKYVLLPYVVGHSGGTTTIAGKAADCSPKLSFDWGH